MKLFFLLLVALTVGVTSAIVLNDGWTADGVPVTLPHCWNVDDGTDGPSSTNSWNHDSVSGTGYARRKVTYRRSLEPSTKTRYLRVNAASIRAVVKLDGREIGRHDGAFTAFTVEIPALDAARCRVNGKQVVEIEVDNFYNPDVPPVSGDFTMYGGLYRGVDLLDEPEDFSAPSDLPKYEFRDDGFCVDGRKTFLKGVCYHQDRGGKGWAISAADEEDDIRLIKAMGANAIRTSHYPRSERFYDLCDKYGILVWTEIPLVDLTTDSAAFRSNTLAVAREMVLQHRKHRCIAMWGLFNELYLAKMPDGQAEPLVREVKELIASLDPRPTVAASCMPERKELNSISDGLGFNLYPGWYGGKATELNAEIERRRKTSCRPCVAISEYGAGGSLGQFMPTDDYRPAPGGPFHPVDYQLKVHREGWESIRANPNLWGIFLWVMFDAGSDNRHEGARNGINDKGLVDFTHTKPKPAYDFYRRIWNESGESGEVARFDPRIAADGSRSGDGDFEWIDGTALPLESKGFSNTQHPYDRLPDDLLPQFTEGLRTMQRHATGHYFLLRTDSPVLAVRWSLEGKAGRDPLIPPQGMYGVDIYRFDAEDSSLRSFGKGGWRFLKNGRLSPPDRVQNQASVRLPPGTNDVLVYLPTRGVVKDISFGVRRGAELKPGRHLSGIEKPVVHYGTSIVHGGCASRPGLCFTSQAGRLADVPYVNLGFSGCAKLEPEVARAMARIDASLYIVDPVWNCDPKIIDERCETFLRILHEARPTVPILLCEGCEPKDRLKTNETLCALYGRIVQTHSSLSSVLHYLPAEGMLPKDGEATHDSCHPNDYGSMSLGWVFAGKIREILGIR